MSEHDHSTHLLLDMHCERVTNNNKLLQELKKVRFDQISDLLESVLCARGHPTVHKGIDLVALKSGDIYLVKVPREEDREQFNAVILKRLFMSNTNKPPISISRLANLMSGKVRLSSQHRIQSSDDPSSQREQQQQWKKFRIRPQTKP
ncbi:60S ribosomal protein L18-3 [Acorus calamus]|uniref:60S ribosomal protein L18-3 n=1 Tax=Acorus calamus TaxID=4465 RepID=A0AAV9DZR8_ACOCL|nr:60S ribosomal protein L18-3 [Acorus calamus]